MYTDLKVLPTKYTIISKEHEHFNYNQQKQTFKTLRSLIPCDVNSAVLLPYLVSNIMTLSQAKCNSLINFLSSFY